MAEIEAAQQAGSIEMSRTAAEQHPPPGPGCIQAWNQLGASRRDRVYGIRPVRIGLGCKARQAPERPFDVLDDRHWELGAMRQDARAGKIDRPPRRVGTHTCGREHELPSVNRVYPRPHGPNVGRSKTARRVPGEPSCLEEVADRPLSIRKRTEVFAPPFFDLPLYRAGCYPLGQW